MKTKKILTPHSSITSVSKPFGLEALPPSIVSSSEPIPDQSTTPEDFRRQKLHAWGVVDVNGNPVRFHPIDMNKFRPRVLQRFWAHRDVRRCMGDNHYNHLGLWSRFIPQNGAVIRFQDMPLPPIERLEIGGIGLVRLLGRDLLTDMMMESGGLSRQQIDEILSDDVWANWEKAPEIEHRFIVAMEPVFWGPLEMVVEDALPQDLRRFIRRDHSSFNSVENQYTMRGFRDDLSGCSQTYLFYTRLSHPFLTSSDQFQLVVKNPLSNNPQIEFSTGMKALFVLAMGVEHLPQPEKIDLRGFWKRLCREATGIRLMPLQDQIEHPYQSIAPNVLKENPNVLSQFKQCLRKEEITDPDQQLALGLVAARAFGEEGKKLLPEIRSFAPNSALGKDIVRLMNIQPALDFATLVDLITIRHGETGKKTRNWNEEAFELTLGTAKILVPSDVEGAFCRLFQDHPELKDEISCLSQTHLRALINSSNPMARQNGLQLQKLTEGGVLPWEEVLCTLVRIDPLTGMNEWNSLIQAKNGDVDALIDLGVRLFPTFASVRNVQPIFIFEMAASIASLVEKCPKHCFDENAFKPFAQAMNDQTELGYEVFRPFIERNLIELPHDFDQRVQQTAMAKIAEAVTLDDARREWGLIRARGTPNASLDPCLIEVALRQMLALKGSALEIQEMQRYQQGDVALAVEAYRYRIVSEGPFSVIRDLSRDPSVTGNVKEEFYKEFACRLSDSEIGILLKEDNSSLKSALFSVCLERLSSGEARERDQALALLKSAGDHAKCVTTLAKSDGEKAFVLWEALLDDPQTSDKLALIIVGYPIFAPLNKPMERHLKGLSQLLQPPGKKRGKPIKNPSFEKFLTLALGRENPVCMFDPLSKAILNGSYSATDIPKDWPSRFFQGVGDLSQLLKGWQWMKDRQLVSDEGPMVLQKMISLGAEPNQVVSCQAWIERRGNVNGSASVASAFRYRMQKAEPPLTLAQAVGQSKQLEDEVRGQLLLDLVDQDFRVVTHLTSTFPQLSPGLQSLCVSKVLARASYAHLKTLDPFLVAIPSRIKTAEELNEVRRNIISSEIRKFLTERTYGKAIDLFEANQDLCGISIYREILSAIKLGSNLDWPRNVKFIVEHDSLPEDWQWLCEAILQIKDVSLKQSVFEGLIGQIREKGAFEGNPRLFLQLINMFVPHVDLKPLIRLSDAQKGQFAFHEYPQDVLAICHAIYSRQIKENEWMDLHQQLPPSSLLVTQRHRATFEPLEKDFIYQWKMRGYQHLFTSQAKASTDFLREHLQAFITAEQQRLMTFEGVPFCIDVISYLSKIDWENHKTNYTTCFMTTLYYLENTIEIQRGKVDASGIVNHDVFKAVLLCCHKGDYQRLEILHLQKIFNLQSHIEAWMAGLVQLANRTPAGESRIKIVELLMEYPIVVVKKQMRFGINLVQTLHQLSQLEERRELFKRCYLVLVDAVFLCHINQPSERFGQDLVYLFEAVQKESLDGYPRRFLAHMLGCYEKYLGIRSPFIKNEVFRLFLLRIGPIKMDREFLELWVNYCAFTPFNNGIVATHLVGETAVEHTNQTLRSSFSNEFSFSLLSALLEAESTTNLNQLRWCVSLIQEANAEQLLALFPLIQRILRSDAAKGSHDYSVEANLLVTILVDLCLQKMTARSAGLTDDQRQSMVFEIHKTLSVMTASVGKFNAGAWFLFLLEIFSRAAVLQELMLSIDDEHFQFSKDAGLNFYRFCKNNSRLDDSCKVYVERADRLSTNRRHYQTPTVIEACFDELLDMPSPEKKPLAEEVILQAKRLPLEKWAPSMLEKAANIINKYDLQTSVFAWVLMNAYMDSMALRETSQSQSNQHVLSHFYGKLDRSSVERFTRSNPRLHFRLLTSETLYYCEKNNLEGLKKLAESFHRIGGLFEGEGFEEFTLFFIRTYLEYAKTLEEINKKQAMGALFILICVPHVDAIFAPAFKRQLTIEDDKVSLYLELASHLASLKTELHLSSALLFYGNILKHSPKLPMSTYDQFFASADALNFRVPANHQKTVFHMVRVSLEAWLTVPLENVPETAPNERRKMMLRLVANMLYGNTFNLKNKLRLIFLIKGDQGLIEDEELIRLIGDLVKEHQTHEQIDPAIFEFVPDKYRAQIMDSAGVKV